MGFRRRFSRFMPDENQVRIQSQAGLDVPCEVQNESYGGLGVVVDDGAGIEEGLEVVIAMEGSSFEAVVTSCRKQADGGTFVGIKWLESDVEGEDADDEEPGK